MGRKKSRPVRSGRVLSDIKFENGSTNTEQKFEYNDQHEENSVSSKPFFIDIDHRSDWTSDEHFDLAEVVVNDMELTDGFADHRMIEDSLRGSNFSLRFRLCGLEEGCFRLGQWPVLSADNIFLEYVVFETHGSEDSVKPTAIFSGTFDGQDEGVSGLVQLVSQKLLALRLVSDVGILGNVPSFRVRVEILRSAFDACGSLLEVARQPWRKSMMKVMSWLRPEVTTSEAIYGSQMGIEGFTMHSETAPDFSSMKHARFDAADFYEAIKPSKEEPMLEDELPDLLPQLRPYQRRAAYWMVDREKGVTKRSHNMIQNQLSDPFCVPVNFLERHLRMFYNPFSGNISLNPESSSSYVSGGILADEMGLGKTVELLACIFAHRKSSLEDCVMSDTEIHNMGSQIKRQKRERVECICGAASESINYEGLWVQCDICDAWQHADCVGYSPNEKFLGSPKAYKGRQSEKVLFVKSKNCMKKKDINYIKEMDGTYICSMCSELIEAAKFNISSGTTLIVCPAPILGQWHSEITRHTRPGSLKICIYEGARSVAPPTTLGTDISELATADIVLTTYDVLKEDLSHDYDRHEGDRRFMRFQKRYPVVPTVLTRINWWRLCLDEAQMVECNTASVTEMALRLCAQHRWCITGTPIQRKLDDMYGLLHFLRASPFDVYRWWVQVIRDPYERRDVVAMEFIHKFFKQIMWRSSKMHVSEELKLPPQVNRVSWLTFSPVEEHFYQKQHETCMTYAHEVIESFKGPDVSWNGFLSHIEVAKLLCPLLKLRQACCHPQVGSSGLRSLQQSPLTMEEILEVLIGKTKIEGEEALRKIVVALNGLAAIAIIEQDHKRAESLYIEALDLAEENCDDFRLDPLLTLHIHHNLAELLTVTSEFSQRCSMGAQSSENSKGNREVPGTRKFDQYYVKRRKTRKDSKSVSTTNDQPLEQDKQLISFSSHLSTSSANGEKDAEGDAQCRGYRSFTDVYLRKTCENIKQKFLSVFISKLSSAQREFRNSYVQVSGMFKECRDQSMAWWLHALNLIELKKDSSEELIKKIDIAFSRGANSSRFQSVSALKLTIQTRLDSLETSRQALLERLVEIDHTMEQPKDDDIDRVRYCPNCRDGDGPLCIHCELNYLFQAYEARLFLMKSDRLHEVMSAEEALDLQKQKSELNLFFRATNTATESNIVDEKCKQRHVRVDVQVSRNPSELEITLRVIKSYAKAMLGRQGVASARKHLVLFEAMRKEFAHARCLSIAQSQLLAAHDEIKMSTSRLRLRETEAEPTSIDVLSREQLIPSSMQFSSDKYMSLSSLIRIKGQLRYLMGLVRSKQKTKHEGLNLSSKPQVTTNLATSPLAREQNDCSSIVDDEPCPICHEKLHNQKMVFQCGHVICCKCCLQMTELAVVRSGKCQKRWIMCPTCRQHTDIENIAFVDDKKNEGCDLRIPNAFQGQDMSEISIKVQGSYGTKIEAVTRRILWIKSTDQEAKVLVFSSWNDVLDVLGHALDANDISFVRMKGGRKSQVAIAQFKGQKSTAKGSRKMDDQCKSKPIQVLLILIQHGANGLNLLEAQHVILIEPLLNPAAEAQAINRVHRIGQDKKTFVHRFVVKNTVEESIYKLNRSRTPSSIIGVKSKHQDQPVLTLQDVESLFSAKMATELAENVDVPAGSLRHLPPSIAAGLAAERRLMESHHNSS